MSVHLRKVAAADGETRLDRWFRRHYPALTQGALQKMLRTGQVRVDGKRAEANTRLLPGQEIRIPPMPDAPAPKAAAKPLDPREAKALEAMVIHRDADVLVLDKPHGLPVQGGPGIAKHLDGMLDALRFGAEDRPRLVHRLDRDTSGVLVLARTAAAAAKLAAAFRGRDVQKTYWAVTVGEPTPPAGRIDLPLVRQGGPRGERTAPAEDGEGARAVTDFRILDAARRRAAWLELNPITGRTHQLRVHCAEALGCPILGDGKYGGAAAHMEGLPAQLHLHARALRFRHPAGGTLEVSAPLPPHMKETFAFFGFEAPRTPKPKRSA
ncbi:RluA family pseudouridine synthase [Falsiroseomonas bella]|uniref:Pseudouridine synthase n=1 Tax=Falsiroseomonas bella TaxID=2184016 RepID=A0A317F996_9PROT|nr:RluA family pseudouridine synthase [Falsiroseomonas bella]PWS35062.1 RluA family pseudouridine synthase [Falsiroseomonas bella]